MLGVLDLCSARPSAVQGVPAAGPRCYQTSIVSEYTSKSGATHCSWPAGKAWLGVPGRKRGEGVVLGVFLLLTDVLDGL
jgi:hypothetical protein